LWVEAERRANALQDEAQWVASDDEFWTEAARTADHLQHASPYPKTLQSREARRRSGG
jgi:hypothetical protein